jgi:hypothetical protein
MIGYNNEKKYAIQSYDRIGNCQFLMMADERDEAESDVED